VVVESRARSRVHSLRRSRRLLDCITSFFPRKHGRSVREWRHIGILLQWGIGDAVLALPLLQGLSAAYPDSTIDLIGNAWLDDLFAGEPWFGKNHILVPPWTKFAGKYQFWKSDYWSFLNRLLTLRKIRFDLLIALRFDPREVLQLRILNASETAGFSASGGRHFITHDLGLEAEEYFQHYRGRVASIALARLTSRKASPVPLFQRNAVLRVKALRKLARAGYRGGRILAVHAGAGHPIRQWPTEHFNSVLAKLSDDLAFVVVVDDGTRSDRNIQVPKKIPSMIWLSGLAEIRGLAELCDVILCCDSGIMHMAAACDCPVVAIFGPGSIDMFAPQGGAHRIVKVDPMPCRPCFDKCIYTSPICMERITVESVVTAVRRTLCELPRDCRASRCSAA
jgi:heptosyltransferase-2